MLRLLHFLLLWNFICGPALKAQEYSYVNYNTREGLAGSVVYCMVQDRDGFMWFGTETGLSRFDGTRFKNFTTADGLPDNEIVRLFTDSKNRVWIAPFKNTLCYYWRGKIYNAENDSTLKKIKLKGEVIGFVENAAGDIGFADPQSVTVIGKNGNILKIDSVNDISITGVFWTGLLKNGSIGFEVSCWRKGVYMIEIDGTSVKSIKYVAGTGNLYKTTYHSKELEIQRKTDSIRIVLSRPVEIFYFPNPDKFISNSFLNDSLISFNSSKVEVFNTRSKKIERTLLQGKNTSMTMIDRENNFWFATQGHGVYKLPSLEYRNFFIKENQQSLPVFSLLKWGDSLYAGSSGFKLWTINTKNGNIKERSLGKSLNLGRVITLNRLRDGSLLAGSDHALIKVNGKNLQQAEDVYASVKSTHIYGDSVLVGQSVSTVVMSTVDFRCLDTVWWGRTTAVFKKNDQYFIGTLNGLNIVKGKQKPFYAGDLHAALRSKISAICEDRSGNVWIATNGSGVVGYRNGRVFAWINKDSGLTSNICRSIFANENDLWIGTEQGLVKATYKNNSFNITRYTISDGLVSNIINAIWVDGFTVYVATPEGISYFDESKVSTNSMCVLKITSIQSPAQRWAFDTSGLMFPYKDRDIRIEFVGISFKSAGGISYRYRLKGVRDEWLETSDNFLNFAALPSGTYELELQATNKFGVTSDIEKLVFIIQKPFWEKIWFRLLILLLLGTAIWKFVHYRIQSERNKQAQKTATNRKMAELEQMALKAQMNPHFIFNSLHSIQQYVLDKDIRGANKFISDFARLIRLTLNISMQPKITLHDEINYLSTYLELEKTRLETKFDYSVDVAGNIDVEKNYIPAMILQPHVENSIRHGVNNRQDKEGFIKVTFHIEKGYLVCTVEDNGVGRSATYAIRDESPTAHQSKGMRLTQNRIELLNKDYELPILSEIEDVQTIGDMGGTKVTIRFPLTEVKKPV